MLVEAPGTLTLRRHRDLVGRGWHTWLRHGLLVVPVALIVLGLLNVFGQHPSSSHADGPAAALDIYSPARVRGGLLFESRFTIRAHRDLKAPKLVLDSGWFEQMTINSLMPQPSVQTDRNGRVVLTFDSLPAGQKLVFWLFFQVNPTNIGHRSQDIELDDGDTPLLHVERSVTVFP
jgi:hypothetical protein